MAVVAVKACTRCKQEKPLLDMAARSDRKNGRGHCKDCQQKYLKEYHAVYRSAPGEKERQRKRTAAWREKQTPDRMRNAHLRKTYGITLDDYEVMLVRQRGACAICKTFDPKSQYGVFVVDHDHSSGKVRQLLCVKCNLVIGSVNDNAETLVAAAMYVRKHERLGKAG